MGNVLIVGATSKIAHETGKLFANAGAAIFLAGRDEAKLAAVRDDLRVRGASKVEIFALDLNDMGRHEELIQAAIDTLSGLDTVLIAHGTLPDQPACERSVELTMNELKTNFLSVVSLLTMIANYFESRRRGCIAVITSVAGDRGRQSNYVYGAAKGGVAIFLQGMRNRLSRSGIAVITIKPGFVDTPMTAALEKNLLYTEAAAVARTIFKAISKRKDIVYVPRFWRWIMLIVTSIPEGIFKRMRL